MKRIGAVALFGAVLLLAVLASRPKPVPSPVEPRRPAASPAGGPEAGPETAAAPLREAEKQLLALCDERDRLVKELRRLQKPVPPPTAAAADDSFRLAERYFQEADYAGAIAECEKALAADPGHASARALLKEARFHLGNLRAPSAAADVAGAAVRLGVAAAEEALVRAARHIRRGELEAAERECRKTLEYIQALPPDAATRDLERVAQEQLDQVRAARR